MKISLCTQAHFYVFTMMPFKFIPLKTTARIVGGYVIISLVDNPLPEEGNGSKSIKIKR